MFYTRAAYRWPAESDRTEASSFPIFPRIRENKAWDAEHIIPWQAVDNKSTACTTRMKLGERSSPIWSSLSADRSPPIKRALSQSHSGEQFTRKAAVSPSNPYPGENDR